MVKKYQYSCGCSFNTDQVDGNTKIEFDSSIENINLEIGRAHV